MIEFKQAGFKKDDYGQVPDPSWPDDKYLSQKMRIWI